MGIEPITRQEKIIAGQNLTPITRMEKFLKNFGGGGGGVQSDWNQNDDSAADYVKNRPFYTGDPVETVILEENTVTFSEGNGLYVANLSDLPYDFSLEFEQTYKVSWDGTVFECTCAYFNGALTIGNLSIPGAGSDTGEPFFMGVFDVGRIQIVTSDTSASHTISISGFIPEVIKIDRKYLPKVAFITYDSSTSTYNSDLTNDELYEIMLDGEQVVCRSSNECIYLTGWKKKPSGRIDLIFDGGTLKLSLFDDGTIGITPIGQ